MIVNGYCIKQDINGHDYIDIVNPDCNDEYLWYKHWYNLLFSIKDIIPDYEKIHEKIIENGDVCFSYQYNNIEIGIGFDTIVADGNNELIKKIANLLEESNYFSKISRNDCSEKHHCKWCSDDVV